MAKRRKFRAHFLRRGKWWVAWTNDIPGALTQGRTLEEARENLKDAVRLMLEPLDSLPEPKTSSRYLSETLSL
jgi:predicted RNase H-like HicB family nuclease